MHSSPAVLSSSPHVWKVCIALIYLLVSKYALYPPGNFPPENFLATMYFCLVTGLGLRVLGFQGRRGNQMEYGMETEFTQGETLHCPILSSPIQSKLLSCAVQGLGF